MIPWVNGYIGTVENGCTASEFTQDEGGMLLVLAIDVFVTCEVHTVTKAGDNETICYGEKREILVIANILMQVYNWLIIESRISAVDACYYVNHSGLEFYNRGCGQGDLD